MNGTEPRYGFIGVIVEDRKAVPEMQRCLSEYGEIILGRMGLPHLNDNRISIITLIVHASTDIVGSLTGRLGSIPGITVKSALAKHANPK